MARNTKPRLGRGLSSLMSEPVPVQPAPEGQSSTEKQGGTKDRSGSPKGQGSIEVEPKPQAEAERGEDQSDAILHIRLDDIIPNNFQPRTRIDEAELAGLSVSIRETGLMQPIAVRRAKGASTSKYELIAGERRWRAARLAGLERIPAILHDADDRRSAEWAIIENVQREDLNPIDRGMAYANLAKRFGLTHAEIADRVGVDRSTIANLIRIVSLEPEIRDLVASGRLSTGHAKALLSMPGGAERIRVAQEALERGQTVRALEAICASHGQEDPVRVTSKPDEQSLQIAAAIEDLAKGIGEHLGTKVRIRTKDGLKGVLEIDFYDLDHFDGLMNRIGYVAGRS
jgi:ParB family transcriptional regulator, chromosome partitioning protein